MEKTLYTTLALTLMPLAATVVMYYILKTGKRKQNLRKPLKQRQKQALHSDEFDHQSHDFRTPLTSIIGQLESIIQTESFTPGVHNKLLSVYETSLQMKGLIADVHDSEGQDGREQVPHLPLVNEPTREMINKVAAIVDKHIDNPDFSVDQLASEAGMARTNLYIRIKAMTGQTPNKFILTTRLKKAAHLLRNHPELRISEISDVTGFTSAGYFGKCFKEHFNATPMSYRSEIKNVGIREDR